MIYYRVLARRVATELANSSRTKTGDEMKDKSVIAVGCCPRGDSSVALRNFNRRISAVARDTLILPKTADFIGNLVTLDRSARVTGNRDLKIAGTRAR